MEFLIKEFETLSIELRKERLNDKEIMESIFLLSPSDFSCFFSKLEQDERDKIIDHYNKNISYDDNFFIELTDTVKKSFLSNYTFLENYIKSPRNDSGKYPIETLTEELKLFILMQHECILNNTRMLLYLDNLKIENQEIYLNDLARYMKSGNCSYDENNFILQLIYKLYNVKDNKEEIKNELKGYLRIKNLESFDPIFNLLTNEYMEPSYLLSLSRENQLIIYIRFGIFIPNLDEIEKDLKIHLDTNLLRKINAHDIKRLYLEFKNKGISKEDNYILLVTCIKLYSVFGFDNSIKIIQDKFSNPTGMALKRAAQIDFLDNRRRYRLSHQDEFYSHNLVLKVASCLEDSNYEFIADLFKYNEDEVIMLVEHWYNEWKVVKHNSNIKWHDFIAEKIRVGIVIRENKLRDKHIEKFIKNYNIVNKKLSYKELFEMFKNIDISNIQLDQRGRVLVDSNLTKFLLGNEKKDNDCTLRLIFNELALDLNTTFCEVINNFSIIKDAFSKSKGKMALNSILDVIDASKSILYNLKPNEQDISFETVSKLQNNRKYCFEPADVVMKKALHIHKDRKWKVSCTIPTVKGKTQDNVAYQILPFDSDKLLRVGIDSDNCLCFGGVAETFLIYCLTSKFGAIISIIDQGIEYSCPITRNGNTIYGNGIDPKPAPGREGFIVEAIRECYEKICLKSDNNEPIEIALLTNHHLDKRELKGLKEVNIPDDPIVDDSFYCDYTKDKSVITNYVLYTTDCNKNIECYRPTIEYYQSRPEPFSYIVSMENKRYNDKVSLIINSINYTCYTMEKKQDENYESIDVNDFTSIIGNKDWFIGIKNNYSIEAHCLPYDKRARTEMYEVLKNMESEIELLQSTEKYKKKIF